MLIQAQLNNDANSNSSQQNLDQTLQAINGQQLLNKSDPQQQMQSLFLNIPVQVGETVGNLKVHINGKKDGKKIDWENCTLAFYIETKKMGDTGIILSASERNLTVTVKNDHPQFKAQMEPLVNKYKERLKDVGYHVKSINFSKLNIEQK